MTKEVKNTLLMTAFALFFGLILGLVHEVTAGPIAAQKEKALKEAYQAVIPDATEFNDIGVTPEGAAEAIKDGDFNADITSVKEAVTDDMAIGYVIDVVSHGGYGGDIAFSMGVDEGGSILGISITSISETPGLGMRAKTDPSFCEQFLNKEPGTEFVLGENVDAITSATFTSRCINRGVNAGLAYVDYVLGGGEIK